jgi:DNA primase
MAAKLHLLKQEILNKGINVFDCLEHYTLDDIYDGTRREQQIKCPGFHGEDRRKSARIYENGTMYCWACDASYDVFAFEMKYTGLGFTEVLYQLAERYGIEVTYSSDEEDDPEGKSKALSEIKDLFSSMDSQRGLKKFQSHTEHFSRKLKQAIEQISLEDFQKYWYIFDQIRWRVSQHTLPPEEAIMHLDRIYREALARRV